MKIIGRNQKPGNEISVVKTMPKGWKTIEGAMTQPAGTIWISNGKGLFKKTKGGKYEHNKDYQHKLLVVDDKLFKARMKESSSYYSIVRRRK